MNTVSINFKGGEGFTVSVVVVSALLLLGGFAAKKPSDKLANAQASWDKSWLCARCGHQWQQ